MKPSAIGRYALLILFTAFVWGFSLLDMLSPDRETSQLENRTLQTAPAFSADDLLRGSYALEYEEYINDQFLLRDGWITVKSLSETSLGKLENNGVIYGDDHYMFDKFPPSDPQALRRQTNFLVEMAEKYPGRSITLTIIPSSYEILSGKLPAGVRNERQLPAIAAIYRQAEQAGIRVCDVTPALLEHAGEYIYYRTDHHWTARGAWLGYMAYADVSGTGAAAWEDLPPANSVGDFYGTFFSKAKLFSAVPDVIDYYDIPFKEVTVNGEEKNSLYDLAKFEERDKYAALLHGNNAITVLQSGRDKSGAEKGMASRVLLIKDSFGNSLAPYLLYSYDEVVVIDLRYFNNLEGYLSENDFDDIYILYNYANFLQDTSLAKLRR